MNANTHNNYFSLKGGGAETDTASLTSAGNSIPCHAELVSASQKNSPHPNPPLKGGREELVSKAHATHLTHITHAKRAAFTLAEVLITLAIIGIVAAMTIPTLVANYQNKAWNTSASVFERKLEEALRQMNTQQILAGYKSTADFVGALGKYFKINKVCNNNDLMSCFEDKVYWGADEEEVDMTKIKNASNFGQDDWDTELIGVQFANGTTGLIAYNPECKENPYTNQFKGTSCLALLYDTTGFKTPNTQQKDLRSINVKSLDGRNCAFEIDDICFTAPFYPELITKPECEQLKDDLGIKECYHYNDFWAGAVKACGGVNKMPTQAQLTALAEEVYGTSVSSSGTTYADWNKDKLDEMGFDTSPGFVRIWSGEEHSKYDANNRHFEAGLTYWRNDIPLSRGSSVQQAVCLGD